MTQDELNALDYEQIVALIKSLPMTWIPALLLETADAGYAKKCFTPSGASRLLAAHEAKEGKAEKKNAKA